MPKGLKVTWDHRTPRVSVRLITCEWSQPPCISVYWLISMNVSFVKSPNPVTQQAALFPCL